MNAECNVMISELNGTVIEAFDQREEEKKFNHETKYK